MIALPKFQKIANQPKRLGWIIHTIVWIVLFFFPFFFWGRESERISLPDYQRFIIMLSGILVVFYANYSYLVKKYLFTRHIWMYLLSNLLLYAFVILVSHNLLSLIPIYGPMRKGFYNYLIVFDTIKYIFLTALSVALKVTGSWYQMDTERKELEKQRSEAELQNLKNQLNPHFLFNTLNNIYSLIAINGEQAQNSIHELSRMLRYMLYDSAQTFVPLEKDINFIRSYVSLMRIRLPEHVELKTAIQIDLPEVMIAPLLFIAPIENAFKHGVSHNRPSFIHIDIIATGHLIICKIRNSYFPKDQEDKSGSGIGLSNLLKRLELLYPGNYQLNSEQADDSFVFSLTININMSL